MTRWQTTLANIIDYPEFHAKFLNTLSLLEYIGSRKIMKSQDEAHITPMVLGHMAEEIRHAQILKKMAIKVGGHQVKNYADHSLLCGTEGRAYIQAIDHKAEEVLDQKDSWANYLLTTLIVEERAQEIYPLYDSLLEKYKLSGPLKGIVREEEEHLAQVTELLKSQANCSDEMIEKVREEERKFFKNFFIAVEKEFSKHLLESTAMEMR